MTVSAHSRRAAKPSQDAVFAPDFREEPYWWTAAMPEAAQDCAAVLPDAADVVVVGAGITGTVAALGMSRPEMPYRRAIMAMLISPMIVPIIITATGLFFFYSKVGLANSYLGIILAHATLGIPFVIITVTATLSGFDHSLTRAGASLGASPTTVFRRITVPLILPGIIAGALFAFVTSFDEVVVVLFVAAHDQQTIPRQMWNGIREQISPAILAMATILVFFSISLLTAIELLRRRSERLRGVSRG